MLVERDHIGIFGKMNSGKSSLMNLLTQQQTSIIDSTPGTTADTKLALQEIHGLGPVKIYDTAGLDECSELGEKKRKKVLSDLKECDLVLVIIDPSTDNFKFERELIDFSRELGKQILIVYNIFNEIDEKKMECIEKQIPALQFHKKIILKAIDLECRERLLNFILSNFESKNEKIELLPFVEKGEYCLLNIPMDVETPSGRFLRPQAMCEEYITRKWAHPVSFRMDLVKVRSGDASEVENERKRFLDCINNFKKRPRYIITDSQAMDIMYGLVPDDIKLTTFSIVMINYLSRGKLNKFVDGLKALDELQAGDKVLIVEACNHSRIQDDIGTVQIPRYFKERYEGITIEHNFGREFFDNDHLKDYKLILHCGGCMISSQKMLARIRDLTSISVPFTNYGLFLAYIQGKDALKKVLELWGL